MRRSGTPLYGAGLAVAVAVAGLVLGAFWLTIFSLAICYVLAALSMVVLTGWSGQLNLHVAALGLGWGAYSMYALTVFGVPVAIALPAAGIVTIPFAILIGSVAVRFRGLELAVATLAIGLIFERLAFRNIGKVLASRSENITTFGSSFVPVGRPDAGVVSFETDRGFFYFSLLLAVVVFVLVRNLARGRTGRTLRALREREVMAESLGIPVLRWRVGAFAMSIMIASTAGALLAALKTGITPDSFNIDLSFRLLAATVIGGIVSPSGAVIGGAVAALLPEVVQFGPLKMFSGERLFVLFGVGMILALWRLPEGLAGIGERLRVRRARRTLPAPATLPDAAAAMPSPNGSASVRRVYPNTLARHIRPTLLRAHGVRVRFGGVVALDGVDLSVPEGEIAALIGPNGAGKSTLFNCISGLIEPNEGCIYYRGRDVTGLSAHERAIEGIGRTFQTVEAFREMTVIENLMVAGHAGVPASGIAEALTLPSSRRAERALAERAHEVCETIGLSDVASRLAGELSLGRLRELELGMALVRRPRLLLLDEPSAGLDPRETAALGEIVRRARDADDLSVLLVEHDMTLVQSLAEHVFVLDFGEIIAQGSPERVRRDPVVLERYLGSGDLVLAAAAGDEPARKPKAVSRARRS
ncbi:MAG TPA: branched-chain amino acid ABC transporter ATP-binding protein/permease [Actinomycetota bacterium]